MPNIVARSEVSEFIHTMQDTNHAFRMVVVKKSVTPMLPGLWEMLSKEEKLALVQEHYHVIATNADESMSAQDVVRFYRKRGGRSENQIKELKNGFNLSYLPSRLHLSNPLTIPILGLSQKK